MKSGKKNCKAYPKTAMSHLIWKNWWKTFKSQLTWSKITLGVSWTNSTLRCKLRTIPSCSPSRKRMCTHFSIFYLILSARRSLWIQTSHLHRWLDNHLWRANRVWCTTSLPRCRHRFCHQSHLSTVHFNNQQCYSKVSWLKFKALPRDRVQTRKPKSSSIRPTVFCSKNKYFRLLRNCITSAQTHTVATRTALERSLWVWQTTGKVRWCHNKPPTNRFWSAL